MPELTELELVILEYLNGKSSPSLIDKVNFPQDKKPLFSWMDVSQNDNAVQYAISQLQNKNLIESENKVWADSKVIRDYSNLWVLTERGKATILPILDEKVKHEEKENKEMQKLRGEVELISAQLFDYDTVRGEAKSAKTMSKLSVLIAVLIPLMLLVLKWKCNVPPGQ